MACGVGDLRDRQNSRHSGPKGETLKRKAHSRRHAGLAAPHRAPYPGTTQSGWGSEGGDLRDRQGPDRPRDVDHLSRKVDVRLPGKGKSNSYDARPVHLIITRLQWIRTSRLSTKNSLSVSLSVKGGSGMSFHRGTSLMRKRTAPGPYRRSMHRVLVGP